MDKIKIAETIIDHTPMDIESLFWEFLDLLPDDIAEDSLRSVADNWGIDLDVVNVGEAWKHFHMRK